MQLCSAQLCTGVVVLFFLYTTVRFVLPRLATPDFFLRAEYATDSYKLTAIEEMPCNRKPSAITKASHTNIKVVIYHINVLNSSQILLNLISGGSKWIGPQSSILKEVQNTLPSQCFWQLSLEKKS